MRTESDTVAYTYIDTQELLATAVHELARAEVVAFDLECDNNIYHYGTRVCLMQFATPRATYLIDTIVGLDLAPIRALMENPKIEKIVHDTDFDLRALDAEFGWRPVHLFDTKAAARLLGHAHFGIAALLAHYFDVHHSKQHQRADWSRRPLDPSIRAYAAGDVHYLIALRARLGEELEARGRMAWAREEFERGAATRFEPDTRPLFARVKHAHALEGRQLALLNELAIERDAIARDLNMPVFKIIADERLVALVKELSAPGAQFDSVGGMHPYLCGKGRARFVQAMERGLRAASLAWPRAGSRALRRHESSKMLAALKQWRRDIAAEVGIDPDVLIPQTALRHLAAGDPLDTVLAEEPVRAWQREVVGPLLKQFFSKNADLS